MQPVMNVSSVHQQRLSAPHLFLRVEGIVLFVGAALLFAEQRGNGLIFAALLFAPDLSMLGYLVDGRVGALVYNLVHNYLPPAALLVIGLAVGSPALIQLAAIWFAHIGMDRALGYGLKYATAFKDTHMQRV